MLNQHELEQLFNSLESDRSDRKAQLTEADRFRKLITAFSNDFPNHRAPHVVFVGQNDDGSCAHLAINDDLLTRISNICRDGSIQPIPKMTIQQVLINGCTVAAVCVEPTLMPPARFDGRTWIRVGPTVRAATPEEEFRLSERRSHFNQPFDSRPIPEASIDDLDLVVFEREYLGSAIAREDLDRNHRNTNDQLASLRLVQPGTYHPTPAGLLAIGKDPRQFLPGAYIQFARFSGTTITDPVRDQSEFAGTLSEMIRDIDSKITAHIQVSGVVHGQSREISRPDFPIDALRQAIRNAIIHRRYEGTNQPIRTYWFDDRIEIWSPGGPFGQVTPENIGQIGVTDYRNPAICEVAKVQGFVQRFGMGFPLMRKSLEMNGNPPLEIDSTDAAVLITIRGSQQ